MTGDLKNNHRTALRSRLARLCSTTVLRAARSARAPLPFTCLVALSITLSCSVLDVTLERSVGWAEVTLTTPNGIQLSIDDEGGGGLSASSALSDWPLLCVQAPCAGAGCVPCAQNEMYDAQGTSSTIELSGRQRSLSTQSLQGIDVTRKIYVPVSGPAEADGFVRVIVILHEDQEDQKGGRHQCTP